MFSRKRGLSRPQVQSLVDAVEMSRERTLRQFHRKLVSVATSPIDILVIGDSITEGGNVTDREARYVAKMRDALRAKFPSGATGGEGYVSCDYVKTGIPEAFVMAGGGNAIQTNYGLGRRNHQVFTNNTDTFTFTGTGFRLFYTKGSSARTITVTIDGEAAGTVNSQFATTVSGNVWDSPAVAAGAHTAVFTATSGPIFLEGALVFNGDETKGVRVLEGGHSGYRVFDFIDPAAPRWADAITAIQPALVVTLFGANDYKLFNSPSQFTADLLTLVANIRAKCTVRPSIVFAICHQREDTFTPIAPYADYVSAQYEAARLDGDIGICDMSASIGLGSWASGIDIVDPDKIHLSATGHAFYGQALAAYLAP